MNTEISEARIEKAIRAEKGEKPKFYQGKYGKKYDYWTCGNCGRTLSHEVSENYCWNCGYKVNWENPRCLTGYKRTRMSKEDLKEVCSQITQFTVSWNSCSHKHISYDAMNNLTSFLWEYFSVDFEGGQTNE